MEVAPPSEQAALLSETLPLIAIVHQAGIPLQSEEYCLSLSGYHILPPAISKIDSYHHDFLEPRSGDFQLRVQGTIGLKDQRTSDMPTAKLTHEIILAAIEGFESQKSRIDAQIAELRQMLTGSVEATSAPAAQRGRRKLSAAGRARIAEAQRKRWAAQRRETSSVPEPKPTPPKPKRRLTAAGRRAIIEATKKRWAKVRGEAAKSAASPARSRKAPAKTGPGAKARSKKSTKPSRKISTKRPEAAAAPVSVASGSQPAE